MNGSRLIGVCAMAVLVVVLGSCVAFATAVHKHGERRLVPESSLPQGTGLSAKYPGDHGIGRDPSVVFAEDFEEGSLADVVKHWSEASNKDNKVLAFSDDKSPDSTGKRSIQLTATLGENTGGHLYKRLPRGVDKVFTRFYVKFAPDAEYIHHFVHLGGYN